MHSLVTPLLLQYEAASCMATELEAQMAAGLSLPDFLFHTLRSCALVLMQVLACRAGRVGPRRAQAGV